MIGECHENIRAFGLVLAKHEGMATIGCMAGISRVMERYPDGRLDIMCEGLHRFEIESLINTRAFFEAEVDRVADDGPASEREQREQCAALHFEMMGLIGEDESQFPVLDLDREVAFQLASRVPADGDLLQALLSMRSDLERTVTLIYFYQAVLPKLRTGRQTSQATARNGHVM
jgi:Lon protease-like protein